MGRAPRRAAAAVRPAGPVGLLAAGALSVLLAACGAPAPAGAGPTVAPLTASPSSATPPGPVPTDVLGPPTAPASPAPTGSPAREPSPVSSPAPSPAPGAAPPSDRGTPSELPAPRPVPGGGAPATPAPDWLGTRALGPPGSGPVAPQETPPELLDRRLLTVDHLPPPTDAQFRASVDPVPAEVLARSTWQPACPVSEADLRYVRVTFWGFDGRTHTGELLLHADAVDAVVGAFRAMHAERFPLEQVRIVAPEELDAAPTGDGNTTSAFVCRPVTGGSRWSEHAYGRAVDVNPFHNPYERGTGDDRVVIPELATAYTDRSRDLPGMVLPDSAVVSAFRDAGWGWGGDYRSSKDWMHFSASGG